MRNCNEIKETMSLYIDKELGQSENAEFEEHLRNCPECRRELDETVRLIELCRALPDEELPENFCEQLHEKLAAEKEKHEKKGRLITLKNKYIAICSSIAAVLLIAVLVRGIAWDTGNKTASDFSMEQAQLNGAATVSDSASENNRMLKEKDYGTEDSAVLHADSNSDAALPNQKNSAGMAKKNGSSDGTYNESIEEGAGIQAMDAADTESAAAAKAGLQLRKETSNPVYELKDIGVTIKSLNSENTIDEIKSRLKLYGGSVEDRDYPQEYRAEKVMVRSAVSSTQNITSGSNVLYLKIPDESYETFVAYLKESFASSGIEFEQLSSTDVTGKISEYEERLKQLEQEAADEGTGDVASDQKNKADVESEIKMIREELDKLRSYTGSTVVRITIE